MTKLKLDFLKSSATSTDKASLANNSESSTPSPKSKRFFTLRRKRNNSQTQPLLDVRQGNLSASPLGAINPVAEVAAALVMTSRISTNSSKQLAESLDQSLPAGIQTCCETESQLIVDETTERVATIETLDSIDFKSLGQKKTSMEITKTRDKSELDSGMNRRDSLSYSHSSGPSIIASEAGFPPHIASHEQEQNLQIQFTDQRYEVSKFHHVLEVLQRAARRVEADQSVSQRNIFRSLAPLATFLYLLGMGVLLPRQQRYRYSQTSEHNTSVARMILLFFIGMALALVFLRGMVWLVSVFGKAFCEVDLTQIFRRGECVDVDGRGKGEAELIWGGMFI